MKGLLELYKRLYQLTCRQQDVIEAEEYDELRTVLAEKNRIIELLDQREIESELRDADNPRAMHEKIKDIMKKTAVLEEDNVSNLQMKQSEIRGKLRDINNKEKTRQGYQNDGSYEAKFIDKKS